MARALIVGCGCRGRALGARLRDDRWQVRGTSRTGAGLARIEASGLDAAIADPDFPGDVYDLVEDVAVIVWLMGSPVGSPDAVEALNGSRLESLLAKLVDTPVRGIVYEASGTAPADVLAAGAKLVRAAGDRWRIRFAIADVGPATADGAEPAAWDAWSAPLADAVRGIVA